MKKITILIFAIVFLAQTNSLKAQYYQGPDWSIGVGSDYDWQMGNGGPFSFRKAMNFGYGLTVERRVGQSFAVRAMLNVPGIFPQSYDYYIDDTGYYVYYSDGYDRHLRLGIDAKYHVMPLNKTFNYSSGSLYLLAGGGLTWQRNRDKDNDSGPLGLYFRLGGGMAYNVLERIQLFGEAFYNTASLTIMAGINIGLGE